MPVACDDARALAALDAAPGGRPRSLLRRLWRRGRRAAIDTYLEGLAASGDERLALAALVAGAGDARGWDEARLLAYRADPAPLVAAAAQFTLPPAG